MTAITSQVSSPIAIPKSPSVSTKHFFPSSSPKEEASQKIRELMAQKKVLERELAYWQTISDSSSEESSPRKVVSTDSSNVDTQLAPSFKHFLEESIIHSLPPSPLKKEFEKIQSSNDEEHVKTLRDKRFNYFLSFR